MIKAVIICSGGMDSTTLLYYLRSMQTVPNLDPLYDLYAITFDYGSKHNEIEGKYAKFHCNKLAIPHKTIKLDFDKWGFKSDLLKSGGKIPEGHYSEDTMAATVVPFRNAIMLSIAVGVAESIGATKVFLGSHKGDRAQYKDCTYEFTQAFNLASVLGTKNEVRIESPFNDWFKWDICKTGLNYSVPFESTHSCYLGQEPPCGRCSTDIERIEAFYRNGVKDPKYSDEEWKKAVKHMQEVLKEFNNRVK